MRIAIAGASGFLGAALAAWLTDEGHEVVPLVRPGSSRNGIPWDPAGGRLDPADLAGLAAVVNLGGRGIGKRRFTRAECARLRSSRLDGTGLLAGTLAAMDEPPALINASAVGYYGDRGHQLLDEDSGPGRGFLAELCADWEAATAPATEAGVRVALLRTGIVLGHGGALFKRLIPAFRFGFGGRLGDGTQYQAWVMLDDVVRAIATVITSQMQGPVNIVAPEPVTNEELTHAIGRAMRRPSFMVVPRTAIALVLGRVGAEDLLASQRAVPAALIDAGFTFAFPTLEPALARLFPR